MTGPKVRHMRAVTPDPTRTRQARENTLARRQQREAKTNPTRGGAMSALSTINLNGVEIPEDEVLCAESHDYDDAVGYIVVLTRFGQGRVKDVGYYDPHCYGEARGLAREIRTLAHEGAIDGDYARIDTLYGDGCRVIG